MSGDRWLIEHGLNEELALAGDDFASSEVSGWGAEAPFGGVDDDEVGVEVAGGFFGEGIAFGMRPHVHDTDNEHCI